MSSGQKLITILIVEDVQVLAVSEKNILERKGYLVTDIVASAGDAYLSIQNRRPDIVLMDISIEGVVDGIDAARVIYDTYDIPVIILSAREDTLNIERIRDSGSYGFLHKPFQPYELQTAIESGCARYLSEKTLKHNEQKYRFIFENIQDVYFECDNKGTFLEISPSIQRLAGYDRRNLIGSNVQSILVNPENLHYILETIIRNMGGILHSVKIKTLGGDVLTCEIRTAVTSEKDGVPLKIVGSITDVTARREFEEKITFAHREMASLLQSLSSILIGVSIRDIVTHWNGEAEKILGIKAEEIVGKNLTRTDINWQWDRIYEGISRSVSEFRPFTVSELRYSPVRDDIRNGFLNLKITPIRDESSALTGFLMSGEEITEKRAMRIRATRAQKMEAIGQLAAGVAHEINTPTQYINDNTVFVRDSFFELLPILHSCTLLAEKGDNCNIISDIIQKVSKTDIAFIIEEIPKALSQSVEGIGRISKIVGSMRQFSHPGTESKVLYNINKVIENTITISRNEWRYVSEVTTDLDPLIPEILCYPNELGQVFLNLIVNASQAIETKKEKNDEHKGNIHIATKHSGNSIIISVRDTGTGIPDDIKDNIFNPFFTTKPVGKGTGQGLAISHSVICEMHNGEIFVESESGEGSTFTISIPIDKQDSELENNEV